MHMAVMNQKVQKKAEGSSADDFELKRSAAGSVMPLEGEIEAAMRAATVNPLLARQAARRRGEFVPEAPQMPVEEPQATIKPYDPTFRQKMAGLIERGLRNVSPADRARAIAQEGIMGVGGLGVADFVPFIGTGMALQETKRGIEEARREGKPEEAWAELLGGVAAAAPGIGPTVKMAKPVSKALANEAAYRIYQAMERGEGPLAGALAGVRPLKIDVWHGSPHLFQPTTKNLLGEFDPKKIGTGEGNQAFGYGHYLAEKPGTSKTYKRMESEYKRMTQGFEPKVEYAYDLMSKGLDDAKVLDNFAYKYGSQFSFDDAMKAIKEAREHINAGYLYKVNLPDEHISKMLDWDKPLSQQPEVIKALKGTDYEVGLSQKEAEKIADARLRDEAQEWADETGGDPIDYFNNVDWEKYVDNIRKESGNIDSNITGRELHSIIMRDEGYRPELFDPENYQIPTSETLRSYGIPGIRYLDAASRGTGEGTRNFVVFPGNEHMINIVGREKEGGVIRKAEGGITSDDLIIEENPL